MSGLNHFSKMLFDTHVHFDGLGDTSCIHDSVQRAISTGVRRMIAVGGSSEANVFAVQLAGLYPQYIFPAIGFDRDEARKLENVPHTHITKNLFDMIENARQQNVPVVAIGETGLDFYYSFDTARAQIRLFEIQLEVAQELNLPVIVHCRAAEKELLEIFRKRVCTTEQEQRSTWILHCCTGTINFVRELVRHGCYIGLSGIITFKNADNVRQLAFEIPMERILIETDSPYLAPEPYRGKKNEPAFVVYVARKLAELHGTTPQKVAEITTANAETLFLNKI